MVSFRMQVVSVEVLTVEGKSEDYARRVRLQVIGQPSAGPSGYLVLNGIDGELKLGAVFEAQLVKRRDGIDVEVAGHGK